MDIILEINHLVICVDEPEKIVQIFKDFGLTEGEPNSHFGQGTSNKRFFFANIYIELLYLNDPAAAQSSTTKPTKLYDRFMNISGNASPFGVCFYPSGGTKSGAKFNIKDFKTKDYFPKFLPSPLKMTLFNAPLTEPMYFFLDFISNTSREKHQKFKHEIGFKKITAIQYLTPNHKLDSKIKNYISEHSLINYIANDEYIMQLEFDGGTQGKTHDFRPEMPLIFNW